MPRSPISSADRTPTTPPPIPDDAILEEITLEDLVVGQRVVRDCLAACMGHLATAFRELNQRPVPPYAEDVGELMRRSYADVQEALRIVMRRKR